MPGRCFCRLLTACACAVPGHPPVPGPLRHRLRRQHHLRCHRRGRQHWLHLELRPELRRPRHQEPDRPLLARQLGHCRHRLFDVLNRQRPHHNGRQHQAVPGHRRLLVHGLIPWLASHTSSAPVHTSTQRKSAVQLLHVCNKMSAGPKKGSVVCFQGNDKSHFANLFSTVAPPCIASCLCPEQSVHCACTTHH